MTPATSFRIGLKLIGILVIVGLALPRTIDTVVWFVTESLDPTYQATGSVSYAVYVPLTVGLIILWAVGIYLFAGGKAVCDAAVRHALRYCPDCSFDLVGSTGHSCPECGIGLSKDSLSARDRLSLHRARDEERLAKAEGRELPEPWRSIIEAHHARSPTSPAPQSDQTRPAN